MELVVDLHLHSRFSRAVSPRMNLQNMYVWGRKKGLNVMSMADFTHPVWFKELRNQLIEHSEGIYTLKKEFTPNYEPTTKEPKLTSVAYNFLGPYFMMSTEISAIYTDPPSARQRNGGSHRIHNLILSPSFEVAEKINLELTRRGINLMADGRPILGLSSKNLAQLLFEIDPKIAIIPCHVWTPWFSLYGSRSGYDSILDCFGEHAKRIFAVETGLSSDPAMNWRIRELGTRSIVSFSDAHSLEKMGREATVLRKTQNGISNNTNNPISNKQILPSEITYSNILNGFVRGHERVFEIAYTIEYYPEEGKYHYTGHRNCGVSYAPSQTPQNDICPVCHRPLTVGVMKRVEDLATAPEDNFKLVTDANGVVWVEDAAGLRPKSVSLVPLLEILAEVFEAGLATEKVLGTFNALVAAFGTEHEVLLRAKLVEVKKIAGARCAESIDRVRKRNIAIIPGFDGEYGKVAIWDPPSREASDGKEEEQMGLGI